MIDPREQQFAQLPARHHGVQVHQQLSYSVVEVDKIVTMMTVELGIDESVSMAPGQTQQVQLAVVVTPVEGRSVAQEAVLIGAFPTPVSDPRG